MSDYISENATVTILKNPTVSTLPSNSINTRKVCIMSGAAGAAIMLLILSAFCVYSETIQTRAGARHLLDCEVIGTVCHERKHRTLRSTLFPRKNEIAVFSPLVSFSYSEAISGISAQLEHEQRKRGRKVFLVSSVGANEGKSTIAGNLAVNLAASGARVALVDTDFRNPSQNAFFGKIYRMPLPLNRMLAEPFSNDNLGKCVQYSKKFNIFMMFSETAESGATELLTGKTLPKLIQELKSAMDYVIIDSPPMGIFPDAEVLAEMADASLLVVRQDCTPAPDINDAADALRSSGSSFLGVVFNDVMVSSSDSGYGYGRGYGKKYGYGKKSGYGYGYGYGHSSSEKEKSESKRHTRKGGED